MTNFARNVEAMVADVYKHINEMLLVWDYEMEKGLRDRLMLEHTTMLKYADCWENWQRGSINAVCSSHKNTCNNNKFCPGWSKFQCHLMLVFVYSQVVLIGKPLEQKKSGNMYVIHHRWSLKVFMFVLMTWSILMSSQILSFSNHRQTVLWKWGPTHAPCTVRILWQTITIALKGLYRPIIAGGYRLKYLNTKNILL